MLFRAIVYLGWLVCAFMAFEGWRTDHDATLAVSAFLVGVASAVIAFDLYVEHLRES